MQTTSTNGGGAAGTTGQPINTNTVSTLSSTGLTDILFGGTGTGYGIYLIVIGLLVVGLVVWVMV